MSRPLPTDRASVLGRLHRFYAGASMKELYGHLVGKGAKVEQYEWWWHLDLRAAAKFWADENKETT